MSSLACSRGNRAQEGRVSRKKADTHTHTHTHTKTTQGVFDCALHVAGTPPNTSS